MKLLLFILLVYNVAVHAETAQVRYFESGEYRSQLLELYTSEGCSSCPPAEAWLGRVDPEKFKRLSIVPLAFHVTYWDYIGWKDVFAQKKFDQRQRKMVLAEGGRTVYTPQFFINSQTKRGIVSALERLVENGKLPSQVKIKAELAVSPEKISVRVDLKSINPKQGNVLRMSVLTYENDIKSVIEAGENEGKLSHHQYVVRELQTALVSLSELKGRQFQFNTRGKNWSGMVIFLESNNEVIEALNIPL